MISRRPETWTSGEETDNEKAEQPMASPQQQHQPGKAEAQRPGSNGWGTCAELLLVSAVKKYGALNWNLIALELKARAILLNLSPSCFSEEACRFRYNVLKGKFASSSSSGISMGEDVDLDGGVLFEELRKVRMSHLKEELQQYDSTIGQLQTRIRKMKEERAQLKPSKQGGECGGTDVHPKAPRNSESKTPMARKIDELSEKTPGHSGKNHMQLENHGENLSSPGFDVANRKRASSSTSQDRLLLGKDVQLGSTSKTVVKDLSDDLQLAGESSTGRRSSLGQSNQQAPGLQREALVKADDPACVEGEFRAPPSKELEQGKEELERKNRLLGNSKPYQMSRSSSLKGEKDRDKARSRATGSDKQEEGDFTQSSGGQSLQVEAPGSEAPEAFPPAPEPSGSGQASDGRESLKSSGAKAITDDKVKNDVLVKAHVGVVESDVLPGPDPNGKVLEGEAKEARGSKVESGLRKDPDSAKPATISYGRSISKNRSKLRDGGRSQGQDSRLLPCSKPHRVGESGGPQEDEMKAKSKSHISSEQRSEKGKAIGNDLVPCEKLDSGSSKGGSESALTTDCEEAGDKVVELRDLSDVRKPCINSRSVEFKDGRDGKKLTNLNKVGGGRESSDERRPMSANKVLGPREVSEEKKPTNTNRVLGVREAGDDKKSVNKVAGNREGGDEKKNNSTGKAGEYRELGDGKKTMSINKIVNRDQSDEKKAAGSSKELREHNEGKKLVNNSKAVESKELMDGKKASSSKFLEARDITDSKKGQNNNVTTAGVAELMVAASPADRAAERNSLSGNGQALHTSPAPSTPSDSPPKIVSILGNQDAIPSRRRSESPHVFQEAISVKGSKSPHSLHGGSSEQKVGTHANSSHKLKRLDSGKAVTGAEGERKRKAVPKPSPDVKGEGWPVKRHMEQKPKTMDMDTDGVKERKLDPKLKRSRSITNDVSDTLYRKESGDAQEESRDCLESGDRQQSLLDYDNNQIEKSEVGSSMDSIEDMSPSSRKNRREPKVPGKFLPLLECLRVICAHKSAPLFKQRQDYQEKRHYNSVVRRHVDLGMIRSRLEEGAYSGSVEFFRDLLLVFTNALVYNSKDSQEYSGAKALRSCALAEMDKILQTEALLKQHGPATRKREVRKSMEMHRKRISLGLGAEARKKSNGKSSSEGGGAAAAADSQGGQQRTAPMEDSPKAGKKPKVDSAAQPAQVSEAEEARPSKVGHLDNSENVSTKLPPKLKEVSCLDVDNKGPGLKSIGAHSRPPQPTKHGSATRPGHNPTTRGSRYSKRAGDSSGPNPKKRTRK
ncbi:hypothetical protein AXG93_961s1100 [Marchantia polymorpha subsp. ruderalis]|uniref:Bromo domain-containing protein n=1 Tax=Marchantia polymorpha subsp. ruderalis TaxID=1480154 RepID=A0A176VU67_MARPO|nr:hypothetical protein AXG93_961s1100 [Marchantia polymorpha subsp. ruderalis]